MNKFSPLFFGVIFHNKIWRLMSKISVLLRSNENYPRQILVIQSNETWIELKLFCGCIFDESINIKTWNLIINAELLQAIY